MLRKMRDSGVEWIGQVPEKWRVERLQWHIDEIVVKNDPLVTTNVLSLTNDRGVIPYSEKGNIGNKAKEDYSQYKIAYENTIVANSMNILIGSVGLSRYCGCISPVYYVFKNKPNNSIRYFNYLFQMPAFQKELRRYANGILEIRLRVSSSDILKRPVAIPQFADQEHIADYLDEKCAELNAAIVSARQSIEDYKALRVSTITEVITCGLKKSPCTDTDYKWIPCHPRDWNLLQLSKLCCRAITYGIVKLGDYVDDGVKVVRCSDVRDGAIEVPSIRCVSAEVSNEYRRTILRGGEVLVNVRGTLGGCAVVPECLKEANIAREVAMLDVRPEVAVNRFVMYALLSQCFKNYVGYKMAGAIYQGLNIATLCKYAFYAPGISEQLEIAEYLDEKCGEIDALIAEKEALIVDLEAYKKSLIFEVVTGKREVA